MTDPFRDIADKASERAQQIVDRSRDEADKMMADMKESANDLDRKSMDNFAAWRDYLHKYYVLVLAFIGASGIFTSIQNIDTVWISVGIYLALSGILIGFLAINIYFYLERRWFQISNYVGISGFNATQEHPDVIDDPILASRLNLEEKINQFKAELKEARKLKDTKKIHYLKQQIRGHKSEKRLMKYLGQQFGFIEKFWLIAVGASFLLTSVGIVMIFISILH